MSNCSICKKDFKNLKRHEKSLSHQNNILIEELKNKISDSSTLIKYLKYKNKDLENLKTKNDKLFKDNQEMYEHLQSFIFENDRLEGYTIQLKMKKKKIKKEKIDLISKLEKIKKLLDKKTDLIAKNIIEEADFNNKIEKYQIELKGLNNKIYKDKIKIDTLLEEQVELKIDSKNYQIIKKFEMIKYKLKKYVSVRDYNQLMFFCMQKKNYSLLEHLMGKQDNYYKYFNDLRLLRNQICHTY